MVYLTAAVVLVGLLCLLDLVLSLGVIRRLREQTRLLNGMLQTASPGGGVPVGAIVGDFAAVTTDGEQVSRDLLPERTLVGFFSPGCQPCATELPHFVDYAIATSEGRQVLAVVDSRSGDAAEYVERLSPVARVVVEGLDGGLRTAFQVEAFPALYLVGDGGMVLASGARMNDLDGVPETVVPGA